MQYLQSNESIDKKYSVVVANKLFRGVVSRYCIFYKRIIYKPRQNRRGFLLYPQAPKGGLRV
jgi:hypothetical protein